jgi:threonylcarbamoyladenosine tRNA methylthiotransferase MtaB
MFQNTLRLVEECDLTFLHVFPYSEREGTPAAKMPSVDPSARKERAKRLRDEGERQYQKFQQAQVGKETTVIVEQNGHGRTQHFAEVALDKVVEQGSMRQVKITGYENGLLKGDVFD